jgi:YidC/Oxa1 family membrane protein insertase
MGFTTWYQQKQMQARQDPNNPQMAQMQMFAKIMPVMLMFFAFSFPTGVVLYWLTTNVWTIAQQRIMLKAAPILPVGGGPKKTAPKPVPEATPPETPGKPSGTGTANRSKKRKKR